MSYPATLFIRRLIALVAVVLGIVATLAVSAPVGSADPVDCGAVAAQINAHNQAAAVHNANPPDPSNEAAVAAYNAEAERGNAEIPGLQALAAQCRAQGQNVPQVGAPPEPGTPQPCPAALVIVPVAGNVAGAPNCPSPAPQAAPSPQTAPSPQSQAPKKAKGQGAPSLRSTPQPRPNIATNAEPLTDQVGARFPGRSAEPASAQQVAPSLGAPAPSTPMPTPAFITKNPRYFTPQALAGQGVDLPLSPTQKASLATTAPIVSTLLRDPVAQAAVAALPDRSVIALGDPANTDDAVGNASAAFTKLPGGGWSIGLPREEGIGRGQGTITYLTPNDWGQKGSAAMEFPGVTGQATGYDSGHGIPSRAGGPGNVPQLMIPELVNINRGVLRQYENYLAGLAKTGADIVWVKIPYYLPGNTGEVPDYIQVEVWSPNQGWALPSAVFQNY